MAGYEHYYSPKLFVLRDVTPASLLLLLLLLLLYDAVSQILHLMVEWLMNYKLERIWKEAALASRGTIQAFPWIRPRKTTKPLSQGSQCPYRDSNKRAHLLGVTPYIYLFVLYLKMLSVAQWRRVAWYKGKPMFRMNVLCRSLGTCSLHVLLWREQLPPRSWWHFSTRLYGVRPQNTVIFVFTAVRIQNLTLLQSPCYVTLGEAGLWTASILRTSSPVGAPMLRASGGCLYGQRLCLLGYMLILVFWYTYFRTHGNKGKKALYAIQFH
jgi:hypothetical protein